MLIISMLIYAVVASFTPGPNNIMALFFSQNLNFKSSLRFSIGVGFGFLLLLLISSIFNTTLHAAFPKIEFLMKIFAFIYLLYLALKISMSSIYGTKQTFSHKLSGLKSGVMLQLINPKGIIYALTVISTFITPFSTDWQKQLPFIILLTQFLIILNRVAIENEGIVDYSDDPSSHLVRQVLDYMELHYSQEISLEQLENKFFVSRHKITQQFTKLVGYPPYRYLLNLRLQNAQRLLKNGENPQQVATHCGFSDYSNFYRRFKTSYGCSPREFSQQYDNH